MQLSLLHVCCCCIAGLGNNICNDLFIADSAQARKTRIIDVIYNASNNELVRTKTLVKNCIVQIDAGPFRQWYEAHYATALGRKKGTKLVSSITHGRTIRYTYSMVSVLLSVPGTVIVALF